MTPKDEDVSFHRDGSFHMLVSRSTPAVGGRGRAFQELGHCPLFNLYNLPWKYSAYGCVT